jgi:hypothetical protein
MTLGDQVTDPVTGVTESAAERHRAIVEAAAVAVRPAFTRCTSVSTTAWSTPRRPPR